MGGKEPRLHRIMRMEFDHLVRKAELALSRSAEQRGLKQIHLFLPESAEAQLDQNLPHSGRKYVRARLLYPDGNVNDVKVKYRGDFWWHWAYYKKSFRIKTKKERLFQGMRSFNLVVPKFDPQVNNHLAYKLAHLMGLLAPRSEMVNLWVNGSNRGVYLLVEQLEEMTLRHNRRMPGDLYSGELVARDRYLGMDNDLFLYSEVWEKIAVNNHYPEASLAPLEALVVRLPGVNLQGSGQLGEVLETDIWGGFLAYELLTQTFHFSKNHNWRLYFDPAKNRFEPIVWDPNGWHPQWGSKRGQGAQYDIRTSRFHDAMLADHDFLLARHRAIESFFSSGNDRSFFKDFDRLAQSLDRDLSADPSLVVGFRHLRPSEVRLALMDLRKMIAEVFADVKREYLEVTPVEFALTEGSSPRIELLISSRRPLSGIRIEYDRPLERKSDLRLGYFLGGDSRELDLAGATSMRGHSIIIDMPLMADFVPSTSDRRPPMSRTLAVGPGYYWLDFRGGDGGASVQNVYAEYSDGTTIRAERVEEIAKHSFLGVTTVGAPVALKPSAHWSGRKLIERDMVIDADLIIGPGTEVRLKAGASVFIEGRLLAEGTDARPIKFLPAEDGQEAWGAIVLRGQGSNGSVLRHCEFSSGSGHKTALAEYSAMLSIHDVSGVSITDCYFHDNKIVDDMVRAVYSRVEVSNSVFENALFDAVDFDIVEGLVEGCRFSNSRNDALDLMTSSVVVVDSHISFAGDKGISVGEGTSLVAINNYLEGNAIGVESKDTSTALLFNMSFRANEIALNAYHKNWRYGHGGDIYLRYSDIKGHGDAATVGKRSRIHLLESAIEGKVEDSKKIVVDDDGYGEVSLPEFARGFLARIDRSHHGWYANGN